MSGNFEPMLGQLVGLVIVICVMLWMIDVLMGTKYALKYLGWWGTSAQKLTKFIALLPFRIIGWMATFTWQSFFPKKKKKKKKKK